MTSRWRRASILALIALLLVPLALRGHRHLDVGADTRLCAVCLATSHTPVLGTPAPVAIPVLLRVESPALTYPVLQRLDRPSRTGRAPPSAASQVA
jgi:hypothetical protein